ncbi:MAG TPA: hypothetical protein VMV53_03650 [Acidimicrobiales bacterium]|nr:hypothetical protein [Acidimicrobiales bacterium]
MAISSTWVPVNPTYQLLRSHLAALRLSTAVAWINRPVKEVANSLN